MDLERQLAVVRRIWRVEIAALNHSRGSARL
jgi:hypothetical protein